LSEGAGLRTPIHRTARPPRYEIEPADFEVRLAAAHASNDVMLRETPSGLRYLLRSKPAAGEARTVAPRAGERVRTIVFGAIVDPNITTPLPFGGLSYADLNLFGSGTQLNVFFGGAYGQLAWSAPSLGGTRWQASVRAFAIAARYNDRAFRGGVEQYDENITQRPASVSAAVAHPIGGRLRWRGGYDFEYTAFDRTDVTAPAFVVPADAIVHALRTGIDADAGPWTARVWWSPAHRQGWRPWGFPPAKAGPGAGPVDPPLSTFQRFGASVSRTLALSPSIAGRAEVEWVSGRGLDRFSRYTFDSFERRLHGYPTASIRYDRGAVARSIVAWSRRGWRLDGFADLAVVRDPTISRRSEAYPGVGAAVELPGPLRTLWSVDWGYGFRARRTDGGTGTHALRITAYRVF
jgi:hypothetical protein